MWPSSSALREVYLLQSKPSDVPRVSSLTASGELGGVASSAIRTTASTAYSAPSTALKEGGHSQQDLDLVSTFKDVASAFVQQASEPTQVRHLIYRAVRIALAEHMVTAIVLPNDLQDLPCERPGRKHSTVHSGVGYRAPRLMPYPDDLQQAADALNPAETS